MVPLELEVTVPLSLRASARNYVAGDVMSLNSKLKRERLVSHIHFPVSALTSQKGNPLRSFARILCQMYGSAVFLLALLSSADCFTAPMSKVALTRSRAMPAQMYAVTLVFDDGSEKKIECSGDTYVLDQALADGIELPYSCQAGACSTCAGKLTKGTIDQSDGSSLDQDQMSKGFCLTCMTYPTSDCTIMVMQQMNLLGV